MNIFLVIALAMLLIIILLRRHIPIGPAILAGGLLIWALVAPQFHYLVSAFTPADARIYNVFHSREGTISEAPSVYRANPRLDVPVYILTSARTGSAAEALPYTLQAAGRAGHLGGENDFVALLMRQPVADDGFTGAAGFLTRWYGVHLGGVNEVDAGGQCKIELGVGIRCAGLLTKCHGPEANVGNLQVAITERAFGHGFSKKSG